MVTGSEIVPDNEENPGGNESGGGGNKDVYKRQLYGGLKYDADTTALVVENKKYTDIPRDLNCLLYTSTLNSCYCHKRQ